MGKMMMSLTAGVVLGAAVGMMVVPNLNRKTQKVFRKAGKRMINMAEDSMVWNK
ncbi:hypothetical protein [Clostridium tarantellae]|uniref:hypothetical protein n=1 Tax=Clostridium tarantellae TaxID=39493 RepID=UPI001478B033|nr:hypothetical protein [Clostridium tarantellae]